MNEKIIIEVPEGDYNRNQFEEFCKRFGCELLKRKKGDTGFRIQTSNPVNFFWLGANLNFKYENNRAVSSSSEILK